MSLFFNITLYDRLTEGLADFIHTTFSCFLFLTEFWVTSHPKITYQSAKVTLQKCSLKIFYVEERNASGRDAINTVVKMNNKT